MGKNMSITVDAVKNIMRDIVKSIMNIKSYDAVTSYKVTFPSEKIPAKLKFEAKAYIKMISLVQGFSSEVGWHGVCTRSEEDGIPVYTVHDILIYPQQVTGVTTTTDQKEYEDWLYAMEDDVFNNLRFHGHSHVNMNTSPSGVDMEHRRGILSEFTDDDFYVFVIWNKKGEHNITIYDAGKNWVFEDSDIEVDIDGEDDFINKFMKESEEKVTTCSYTTGAKSYSSFTGKGVNSCSAKKDTWDATKKYEEDDDYDSWYGKNKDYLSDSSPYGAFGYYDGGSTYGSVYDYD